MSDVTISAQAEADVRWPHNHVVDDPFGETGEAWSDPYGYDDTANKAFVQGAEWQANRPITDQLVTTVAREKWPYLWERSQFESKLAGLSIFTPEQAAESAEKKRQEKLALVRSLLELAREALLLHEPTGAELEAMADAAHERREREGGA